MPKKTQKQVFWFSFFLVLLLFFAAALSALWLLVQYGRLSRRDCCELLLFVPSAFSSFLMPPTVRPASKGFGSQIKSSK